MEQTTETFEDLFFDENGQLITVLENRQLQYLTGLRLQRGHRTKSKFYELYLLDTIRDMRGNFVLDVEKIFFQMNTYAQHMVRQGFENFAFIYRPSDIEATALMDFCSRFRIKLIRSIPGLLTNRATIIPRHLIFLHRTSFIDEIQNNINHTITLFYDNRYPAIGADYFLIRGEESKSRVFRYFQLLGDLLYYHINNPQGN